MYILYESAMDENAIDCNNLAFNKAQTTKQNKKTGNKYKYISWQTDDSNDPYNKTIIRTKL